MLVKGASGHPSNVFLVSVLATIILSTLVLQSVVASFGLRCNRFLSLPRSYALPLGIVAIATLGYAEFWACWFSQRLGFVTALAIMACALCSVVLNARSVWAERQIIVPSALMSAVLIGYIGLLGMRSDGTPAQAALPDSAAALQNLPEDNVIPKLFADALWAGSQPRLVIADWHGSDRPPLQTGIVLIARPAFDQQTWDRYGYAIVASFCQIAWIAGAWPLLRQCSLSTGRSALVIAMLSLTPFCFINTVYTWPKLLAAAFVLLALALTLRARLLAGRERHRHIALVFATLSLAMLAHGGAAFSAIPLAIYVIATNVEQRRLEIGLATIVGSALLAPWILYQRLYDPPGDRLLKWHVAGYMPPTDTSFAALLAEQYRRAGLTGAISNKWHNVLRLFAFDYDPRSFFLLDPSHGTSPAVQQFYFFFSSESFLILGLFAGVVFYVKRRRMALVLGDLMPLLLFVAVSLAGWALIMFGPATTLNHQGSYAANVVFDLILGVLLVRTSGLMAAVLGVYGVVSLAVVYAPSSGVTTAVMPFAALVVLGGVALAALVIGSTRDDRRGLADAVDASETTSSFDLRRLVRSAVLAGGLASVVGCGVAVKSGATPQDSAAAAVATASSGPPEPRLRFSLDSVTQGPVVSVVTGVTSPHVALAGAPTIVLQGWAVDPVRSLVGRSFVAIDGSGHRTACVYGGSRPDVAAYLGDPAYTSSGFACSLPRRSVETGSHRIALDLVRLGSKKAAVREVEVTFDVKKTS